MVDAKLTRYIFGSVAKHLHDAADAASLPLIVEFLDDRAEPWLSAPNRAEVTISGPATREISSGVYRVWVTVTVVISSDRQTDVNAYNHLDYAGAMQAALDQCITVKNYDVGEDSPETIGFLTPRNRPNDAIPVDNLKPGETDQFNHSVITARLGGYFLEG